MSFGRPYILNVDGAIHDGWLAISNYENSLNKDYLLYKMNPKVIYPHSFRHLFAKNFLAKYNDIALLADLMGHESIETTRIYLRKTATEQQNIVDKIVNW
ncbi:integrase/recombinase, phage integrase family [Streptococcus pneumoniae]|nr:integrase/recombinase, phage integrase family [Streptococcus pneumoniae]